MKLKHWPSMAAAFVLGACATAAVQSTASTNAETSVATIITMKDAPAASTPTGSATIHHLARGKNAYVGLLEMNGDGAVPVHRDATEEFIHVLEGSGTITIEGKATTIAAGDTVYMPAGVEVSFRNGNKKLIGLQVFAGPAPAKKYDAWVR